MGFEENEDKTADRITNKTFTERENGSTTSAEEKSLTCDLCPHLTFSQTYELKRHRKTVHQGIKSFLCELCGKGFAKRHIRNRHMIVHTKEKRFYCDICDRGFTQRMGLNSHNETHHQISVSYECRVCSKIFPKKFELGRHMKKAHYTPEVFYPCALCSKSFKYPSGLKSHLVSHEQVKQFSCSLCNKKYARLRNLCEHKQSAHPEACS